MKWISVQDRLPTKYANCAVVVRARSVSGHYSVIDTGRLLSDGNWDVEVAKPAYKVTHWIALPEIPEERKE